MNREDTMEVMQSGALFTNKGLLETQLMMDPIHEDSKKKLNLWNEKVDKIGVKYILRYKLGYLLHTQHEAKLQLVLTSIMLSPV